MEPNGRSRLRSGLAVFWTVFTIVFLLVLSLLVLRVRDFPLAIGAFRTVGRSGLWITLLPAVVGAVGLFLLTRKKPLGPWLLIAYSVFWFVMLVGALPTVWHAKTSFCINWLNFCIVTPWITRVVVVVLAAPFLFSAIWAWHQTTAHSVSQRESALSS